METYLTQITDYLLTQSWQIAVLVVVVAVVTLLLKNKSAHVRYLLWLVVLAKCLVPPLLTVPLAVLPAEQLSEPIPVSPPRAPAVAFEEVDVPMAEVPVFPRSSGAVAPAVPERAARLTLRQWLGLAWAAGLAVFLLFAAIKALRTNRWLRRERKPISDEVRGAIEGLFSGLGVKTFPKVWLVDGVGQPFVWGLLRGGIYLPADFVRIDDAEHRRGVLGHELSHVLRLDAAVNLMQIIAQTVFWFHPLVWWANKKIRGEREKCCDEIAIARWGAKAKDYSDAIVNILMSEHESTRPVPSLAVVGPVRNIEERIRIMLRPGKKFYKHPSLAAAIVLLLVGLLTVPPAVVLTARAESKTPTERAGAIPIFGNPVNLGPTVNSSAEEYDPHVSSDGLSLYFLSRRPGGLGEADIWVTTRKTKNERWGTPVNLGPPVNSSAFEGAPCLAVDGLELYFVSTRPGGSGAYDIWVTTRKTKNDPWGTPANLGPKINNAAAENNPSISADGLKLYFAETVWSDARPGGQGGADIWVITRQTKDGPWSAPVNLGPTVNSPGPDGSPSISRDGLSLYFNRTSGYGSTDIWVTTRKSKGEFWSLPVNLGPPVNTSYDERNPDISSDGSTLYFVSGKRGTEVSSGSSDIWQVSLKPKAKPAKLLHQAAAYGDMEQVKSLISKGADLSARDEQGNTALHHAVINGRKEVVELLLAKGADVRQRREKGTSPLHDAARNGYEEIAKLLIAKGADVNALRGESRWTPLHSAAEQGSMELVKLLITQGANVNAKDNWDESILEAACWSGHADVAEFLIAKGADVNSKDKGGYTPLYYAVENNEDTAKLLIARGADVNAKTEDGVTPLYVAIVGGNRGLAEFLIAKGADVNVRLNSSRTPLRLAKGSGHTDIVELLHRHGAEESLHETAATGDIEQVKSLIAKGADINAKSKDGQIPLHEAAKAGHRDVAELLIGKGAEIEAKNRWGGTPLMLAVSNGHKDMAELLIAKGANIEAKNKWGGTSLYQAASNGHTEAVEFLLSKGANIKAPDWWGRTPLHIAIDREKLEAAKLLLAKGADVNSRTHPSCSTPLHIAVLKNNRNMVELLLANGANLLARDQGYTPMALAMWKDQKEMVRFLMSRGAEFSEVHVAAYLGNSAEVMSFLSGSGDINARDPSGLTLIHSAICGGHMQTIESLVAQGANVNVQDSFGWAPLHMASAAGREQVTKLFVTEGANVGLRDNMGRTAMHWAAMKGHKFIVEMLLVHGSDVNARSSIIIVEREEDADWTPLHQACAGGHRDVVEVLIAHGADITAKTERGGTAMSVTKRHYELQDNRIYRDVMELLRKHGAKE